MFDHGLASAEVVLLFEGVDFVGFVFVEVFLGFIELELISDKIPFILGLGVIPLYRPNTHSLCLTPLLLIQLLLLIVLHDFTKLHKIQLLLNLRNLMLILRIRVQKSLSFWLFPYTPEVWILPCCYRFLWV